MSKSDEITQNTVGKLVDNIVAAFTFFTRLPFWRLHEPKSDSFKSVVEYWPLTGWLTGGVMALTLWLSAKVLPLSVAVFLAIVVRLLVSGALHEDGLADFFDGFGGGAGDRQRTLDIMKDSHIGTYGVLALTTYLLLLFSALRSMPAEVGALCILAGDPFSKFLAAQMVALMPYARKESDAKSLTIYRRMSWRAELGLLLQTLPPLLFFMLKYDVTWLWPMVIPCVTMIVVGWLVWRRLRGYTGDCCGAACLLAQLAFLLTVLI